MNKGKVGPYIGLDILGISAKMMKAVKFCIIGVVNTLLSYILFVILVRLDINYLISSAIAYVIGTLCSYKLNSKYTFNSKIGISTCVLFFLTNILLLFLGLLMLFILKTAFEFNVYLAQILVVIARLIVNYTINVYIIFNKSHFSSIDHEIHINNSNISNKKNFYSNICVVQKYDALRFNNFGGQYVHKAESQVFTRFLEKTNDRSSVLDIPVGTGRMLQGILALGYHSVSAADYSEAMIKHCQANPANIGIHFSQQDIYHTGYTKNSFASILISRFFFHSNEQSCLLNELSRIVQPGGHLVFDTLSWSPRTWTNFFSQRLGGNIYTNSENSIRKLAAKHGFRVVSVEKLLIIPSFFYTFLPTIVVFCIEKLDPIWPKFLMTKRIWLLRKHE